MRTAQKEILSVRGPVTLRPIHRPGRNSNPHVVMRSGILATDGTDTSFNNWKYRSELALPSQGYSFRGSSSVFHAQSGYLGLVW